MVDSEDRRGVWLDDDGVLHIVGALSSSASMLVHDEGAHLFSELDEEDMERIQEELGEAMVDKINAMIVRSLFGDGVLMAGVPGNAVDMLALWRGDGRRGA